MTKDAWQRHKAQFACLKRAGKAQPVGRTFRFVESNAPQRTVSGAVHFSTFAGEVFQGIADTFATSVIGGDDITVINLLAQHAHEGLTCGLGLWP